MPQQYVEAQRERYVQRRVQVSRGSTGLDYVSLEIEIDARVNLSHFPDGRWPPEKWRRQRPAVPEIVGLIRQVLALDEKLHAIAAAALIHRANRGGGAAAEDADARRQRRLPAERDHVRE